MNKKISGAKLVLVPIRQTGINYFPFVEDLKDRCIKYIDFYPVQYLPETTAAGLQSTADVYVNLANEVGNKLLINNLPLDRFDYTQTLGVRQCVGEKLSMQNSYLYVGSSAAVGKTAALVFYYDLPQFSARNTTAALTVDSLSIPLTTGSFYNIMPDSERMTGKRFRRLLLGAPATTPDYQTGVAAADLNNIYLTLRKGTYCVLDNMPVALLRQMQMLEKTEFANIIFDFQASYLTIGGAGSIPTLASNYLGKSVFFNFVYEK